MRYREHAPWRHEANRMTADGVGQERVQTIENDVPTSMQPMRRHREETKWMMARLALSTRLEDVGDETTVSVLATVYMIGWGHHQKQVDQMLLSLDVSPRPRDRVAGKGPGAGPDADVFVKDDTLVDSDGNATVVLTTCGRGLHHLLAYDERFLEAHRNRSLEQADVTLGGMVEELRVRRSWRS